MNIDKKKIEELVKEYTTVVKVVDRDAHNNNDIPYFSEMNISIKERKDIKLDNSEQPHFLIIKNE